MRPQLEPRIQVWCGKFFGGKVWFPLHIEELKTFMANSIYMRIKKVPNIWAFWERNFFSQCLVISNVLI
jgi:hypothetical protein